LEVCAQDKVGTLANTIIAVVSSVPMISFLFWNLDKRRLEASVSRMAALHEVDVLMLAECRIDPDEMLKSLNSRCSSPYHFPDSESKKIRIFTRLRKSQLIDKFIDPLAGLNIRQLRIGPRPGILLAVVHFPSKIGWDDHDQTSGSCTLATRITQTEDRLGHHRTVLVGDLNMNPFDSGVVSAMGLHAVMTKNLASREHRVVQGNPYRLFYNPMWGCFGDRTPGPAGTYFFHVAGKPVNHYWNMFDQVLLRPELADSLGRLEILTSDSSEALVTAEGLPAASDHLPLFFQLDL
jgi:hypothetical protein